MDLIPDSVCSLCDENTSVLSKKAVQPFIATIGNVFFNAHENGFKQFQDELLIQRICSLCVQKISTCTRFKNKYEESSERNGPTKTRSCFVCEKKGLDLIRTFDDPNDIIAKFTLFTNYSSANASYEDCEMCLDCLFYINSWCEIHNLLIKQLNIDGEALKSFQHTKHTSNFSDNGILKKGKENVTPPHNNIQFSNKKFRTANIEKNSRSAPKSKKRFFRRSKKKKNLVNKIRRDFSTFLNMELKNIKCLQDSALNELNFPESVVSDRKMFLAIPYILISNRDTEKNLDSKERKSSRLNKPIKTINLTDSEEEPVKKPTRVSFQLPPREFSSSQPNLMCNICDKTFLTTCNYKLHCLWHEKPQFCQIDLVRSELPGHVKASNFNVNNTSTNKIQDNINNIMSKYIDISESENINDRKSEEKEGVSLCAREESNHVENDLVNNVSEPEDSQTKLDFSDNESSDKLINENEDETATVNSNITACDKTEEQVTCNANSKTDDTVELEPPENMHNDTHDEEVVVVEDDINCESDIEKALAQLHEDDTNDDKEDDLEKVEVSDNKTEASECKDNRSDDDNEVNKSTRNHKRNSSPILVGNSDDQNTSDENTPKIKKVRFAIDYSYTKRCEAPTETRIEENNREEVEDDN